MKTLQTELTTEEITQLDTCEATIRAGMQTFIDVGEALLLIRDARLYRAEFGTFEDYCRQRWGMVASRARQLIGAAGVVRNLETVTTVTPANEAQARALANLEDDQQRLVWAFAVQTAPVVDDEPIITAQHVKKAAYTVELLKAHGWSGNILSGRALLIDEEFYDLLPALDADATEGLAGSIVKLGVINPLEVWGKTILDGHERYFICMRLGAPFEITPRACESRDEATRFILESQLMRKNYTKDEIATILVAAEEYERCQKPA
jgi:hypothetical protein